MERILDKLLDPSIWIVGLLVGMAARFIGQYLETRWGVFLSWSRARREQLRLERESIVKAWSQDQGLVTLTLLRALESMVAMFAILLVDLLVLFYAHTISDGDAIRAFFVVAALLLTMCFFAFMWINMRQLSIAVDCFREFRTARGLPVPK
jgi:hypothetical protein